MTQCPSVRARAQHRGCSERPRIAPFSNDSVNFLSREFCLKKCKRETRAGPLQVGRAGPGAGSEANVECRGTANESGAPTGTLEGHAVRDKVVPTCGCWHCRGRGMEGGHSCGGGGAGQAHGVGRDGKCPVSVVVPRPWAGGVGTLPPLKVRGAARLPKQKPGWAHRLRLWPSAAMPEHQRATWGSRGLQPCSVSSSRATLRVACFPGCFTAGTVFLW